VRATLRRVGYVVAAVVVVAAVFAAWALWRRSHKPVPAPVPERPKRIADPTPMNGLEIALDQATDRTGRNMREKIETTTAIDDLRVPDDTGPILRRALDQVEHPQADPPVEPPE
jgi:hypothetical protein